MLELTRVFDASPDRVFRAWTDPEQVKRWWGPNGFTTPVCSIDPRPGGAWHYCMHSPDGKDYWYKGIYREVEQGRRIVTTDFFSDEAGNLVAPTQYGMSADWPAEMTITVDFAEEGGKTRLDVRQTVPDHLAQSSGAVQGWSESLDRLATLVKGHGAGCPGMVEPQAEHRWLHRLVGEWTSDAEAVMDPDKPPQRFKGTEGVRPIGELWVIGEGHGGMPGGGDMTTVTTLGFDPRRGRFVGSFVGSMTGHLWLYEGSLDASGRVLTLDTEGPDYVVEGAMAKYQDVVELVDDNHRVLRSRRLGEDGQWHEFMTARYRRTPSLDVGA